MVAMYSGASKAQVWAKWLNTNNIFAGVAYSSDGAVIVTVTYFSGAIIMMFNTADGQLLSV
jgi:hypothetical protein